MKYVSTRGAMAPQAFCDVLLEGLAPDGGLVVPEVLPQVGAAQLRAWRGLSYAELAAEVLGLFASDIPREDLARLTRTAYDPALFGGPDIVTVRGLGEGVSLLGLSNGPTLAFKDMAMQFLGQVFEYVLQRRHTTLNILGATSGDTGSAAEYALRGKRGVQVFMLSPHGRMSAFQRAQMYSLQDENIHNIAIRGVFDECQDIVKTLAGDLEFKARCRLGAVNSINWARIAAQVVYYFHGWLKASSHDGGAVSFTVPSGNFGNVLSGHIARRMGLPIRRLVVATNENNVLEEFFRTGVYRPRPAAQTYATSSPSMDISRASNFERFIYDLCGSDGQRVRVLWQSLVEHGHFDLSAEQPRFETEFGFQSGASTHQDRLKTIASVYREHGQIIDPHTADGLKVALEHREAGVPMLVLETALPAKFSETIEEALSIRAPVPAALADLESLPQRVEVMDCDAMAVRRLIEKATGL